MRSKFFSVICFMVFGFAFTAKANTSFFLNCSKQVRQGARHWVDYASLKGTFTITEEPTDVLDGKFVAEISQLKARRNGGARVVDVTKYLGTNFQ